MLQIQVRTVTDNGSVDASSRVLETHNITYTSPFSASATLEFSVSRADFVPTQFPFLVRVEYAANGGKFNKVPYEDLFIVEQDADDSKDLGQIVTYQAQAFVPWLLAGAYVGTGPFEKDGERTIDFDGQGRASSGHIMKYFIDESKGRGWLPALDYTFATNTDSSGTNWNMDARAGIAWRLETFYTQVLEQLTTQGFCDWNTSGNKLNMYNPGTLGTDYSESVVLGGQDFARVPVKTDMTGWYTHVIAVSDAGRVHVQNTAAEARFGRRSIAMTQSGVKDVPTSTKLANELLAEGLKLKREESYRWTPEAGQVKPWVDFNNGDLVTAMSRGGAKPLRVIGITVIQENKSYAEVEVSVGEKISTLAAKNRKKLDSVSVGGVAGGSGDAFPSNPGPSPLKPAKPVGLRVTSNIGTWAPDGITALTNVGLEWDAVTADIEGSEITIIEYEVWTRIPSAFAAFDTATNTNSVMTTNLRAGEERLISVRARSQAGVWSDFSTEFSVTPATPTSIVPKAPGTLTATNVGAWTAAGPVATVTITIPPVTESTDNEPIEVEEYELWDTNGPIVRVPTSPAKTTLASGIVGKYRARAKSVLGFWGDLSAELTVTGATPSVAARAPVAPVLTTGGGNVFARWNGTYVSGGTLGAHSVRVEARVGTSGTWIAQGTLTSAGEQIVTVGAVGDTVQVRLLAYDQLGRLTGTSTTQSIVVVGVPLADLDQEISDMLDSINDTANNAWDAASVAVKNTVAQYAVGSSDTVAPSSGWSTATPTRTPGSFIWMRSVITFGDDSTSTTSPVLVTGNDGAEGNPGAPGVGITGTVVNYAVGSSGTSAPSSGWGTSIPSVGAGQYLWTRTVTSYSSGNPTTAYSVGRMGTNGSTGAAGKGVSSTEVRYQLHSNGTTAPTGTWQTSPQTQTEALPYLWTRTITTYTDSTTSTAYSVGVRGAKGSNGATGAQGISVTSVQQYYRTTTAAATAPAVPTTSTPPSPWTTTEPAYAEDTALWVTTRVGYSNSTFSYTPVSKVSAFTAASQAQATADGKNRVWYSNTAPPGTEHKVDDVWFDGANGNRINTWSGSAWVVRQMGTDAIANLAITNALIANGTIQNAKIANLDAAKITTGTLNAARIGANSIDVTKLLIQGANLVPNPTFETITGWTAGGGLAPVLSTTSRGRAAYFGRSVSGERTLTSQEIYVAGETTYTVGATVLRQTGTPSPELRLEVVPVNSSGVEQTPVVVATHSGSSTTWTSIYGQYTVPASTYRSIKFRFVAGATTATSGNDYLVQPRIVQTAVGEMIVDGAVKARHVEMDTAFADKFWANEGNFGKINTNMITSDFGSQVNILSNEGITFIAGELATQSAAIDDLDLLANDALTTAQAAEADVATAIATAETANGAALLAKASADGANDRITEHQSVFKITPTGAVISTVNAEQELRLNPSSIELAQNGIAISRWEAGRFIVNETLMNKAQIAEHSFEAYSTKRTIIRPI